MRGLPVLLLLLALAPPAAAQPWASAPERAAGRTALAAANAGRLAEAESLAASADPMLRRIVTWLRLQRPNEASAEEILAFVAAYPDWPFRETLLRRAGSRHGRGSPVVCSGGGGAGGFGGQGPCQPSGAVLRWCVWALRWCIWRGW